MTAQEKADELVDKMYNVDFNDDYEDNSMQYKHAKQCALIAVDEIIDSIEIGFEDHTSLRENNYWNEVKQEIEKL